MSDKIIALSEVHKLNVMAHEMNDKIIDIFNWVKKNRENPTFSNNGKFLEMSDALGTLSMNAVNFTEASIELSYEVMEMKEE